MKPYTYSRHIRHANVKRSDSICNHVSKKAIRFKAQAEIHNEIEYNALFDIENPCFWIDYSEYWLVNTYSSRL